MSQGSVYEIRTLSFTEILDTAFRLLRNHFGLLFGIAAVAYVPFTIVQTWLIQGLEDGTASPAEVGLGVVALAFVSAALFPVVSAAITAALGSVYLGREVRIGEAYREALAIFLPLMGTMLLAGLLIVLGLVLLVIPGIYLMLLFFLVTQVVVLERCFGTRALGRSRELMRGRILAGLGVYFVSFGIGLVLGAALELAFGWLPWLGAVASGIASSLMFAYTSAVMVVFYFDVRCRKEAFDLEHLARLVEAREHAAPATA